MAKASCVYGTSTPTHGTKLRKQVGFRARDGRAFKRSEYWLDSRIVWSRWRGLDVHASDPLLPVIKDLRGTGVLKWNNVYQCDPERVRLPNS